MNNTSCGLETDIIEKAFLKRLPKSIEQVKALFIPTAAIYPDAINVLPKCMNDLLKCGIIKENITVYDLHINKSINDFDLIYLCGGDPGYLLQRINDIGFDKTIKNFITKGGMILGVSAGSMIFANNMESNLGLIEANLFVHCATDIKEAPGIIDIKNKDYIYLGNKQAIVFTDNNMLEIIE